MEDDWHSSSETKTELRTISTTGYLVTENDDYVVVASTWDEATGRYSNAIAILQCCVIKRRKLGS